MAKVSFENLSEVIIHARDNMGINAEVYIDTILGLARTQMAKEQILMSRTGMFSKMWEKVIPGQLEELARNEAMLQAALVDMLQEVTMKTNKGNVAGYIGEVQARTNDFLNGGRIRIMA